MDALWDFSFKKFIAPKIVGILYGLAIFTSALIALLFIRFAFRLSFLSGVGSLIIAPIFFIVYVVFSRIFLEGFIALIRVAEESIEIQKNTKLTAENSMRIR